MFIVDRERGDILAKVAIDAGHASDTSGKRTPTGYREHWFNVMVANYLDCALKRCGIETLKVAWNDGNSKDDKDISLGDRQKLIKNNQCDIAISIHANAHGNGKEYTSANGIETYIHSDSTCVKDSRKLADCVHLQVIKGTKQSNRGIKTSNFAMCNCKNMGVKASILIEYAFMTNQTEEKLIQSESFCKECAEETAIGICNYFGIKYVSQNTSNNTSTKKLYRVQCGAFSNELNAKTLKEKLNQLGFSTTIKQIDGLYKVQVGAFGNKANAESLMMSVRDKGVTATLVYY